MTRERCGTSVSHEPNAYLGRIEDMLLGTPMR